MNFLEFKQFFEKRKQYDYRFVIPECLSETFSEKAFIETVNITKINSYLQVYANFVSKLKTADLVTIKSILDPKLNTTAKIRASSLADIKSILDAYNTCKAVFRVPTLCTAEACLQELNEVAAVLRSLAIIIINSSLNQTAHMAAPVVPLTTAPFMTTVNIEALTKTVKLVTPLVSILKTVISSSTASSRNIVRLRTVASINEHLVCQLSPTMTSVLKDILAVDVHVLGKECGSTNAVSLPALVIPQSPIGANSAEKAYIILKPPEELPGVNSQISCLTSSWEVFSYLIACHIKCSTTPDIDEIIIKITPTVAEHIKAAESWIAAIHSKVSPVKPGRLKHYDLSSLVDYDSWNLDHMDYNEEI